ncbi:MAG: malto-oligosyltrehalose synthase [Pseudolysinimonas sp.]
MTRAPSSTYRLQLAAGFTLNDAAALAGYLRDLGADWFYLSPILQAGEGSTHGYDVVDHDRVDAARGGPDGLRALAAAARDAGLGVLVDIVPNHMGVGVPEQNAWWRDVLQNGRGSRYSEYFDIDWEAGGGRVRLPVDGELNYRRFFAISELAGLRVEVPEVFAASHREILSWIEHGLVDGLRIDHPDGLADPGGYLDALAAATGGAYVVVEKILQHGEELPTGWVTAGTTGYDALAEIDRLFVDPAGAGALQALDATLRPGEPHDWIELTHDTRRAVADGMLHPEVRRLAREAAAAGVEDAEDALSEVLACYPVYRSYLPFARRHLDAAIAEASARRPELAATLAHLARVLGDPSQPAAIRMQQTSGMVMVKGVEDTAFYRDTRLATLTEVGSDPAHFALSPAEFHAAQVARLSTHPSGMTTLTTHDTKRSEDTRARISVLAELPDEWAAFVLRRRERSPLHTLSADAALDNLLWQSIVGCWPRERTALQAYAVKAAREAGGRTTWGDPDDAFEAQLRDLVDTAFDDPGTVADLESFVARITPPGWSNALGAKLLQLTAPGVPDVYQGTELWDFSLVDPDNRRPVDFDARRRMLAALEIAGPPPLDATGAAKLLVTSRALRARRDRPELFTGYTPLIATGPAAGNLVAADRGGAIAAATRLPVGLAAGGGWRDTFATLPDGPFLDVLTGARHPGGATPVAEILAGYPVALLLRDPAA